MTHMEGVLEDSEYKLPHGTSPSVHIWLFQRTYKPVNVISYLIHLL
jgi:hypothetical protein